MASRTATRRTTASRITEEAIVAAVELSDRYVTDRFLPDKAIDLMDQASARVRLRTKTKPRNPKALDEELSSLQEEKDHAAEDSGKTRELEEKAVGAREPIEESGGDLRPTVAEVTAEDIAEVVSRPPASR